MKELLAVFIGSGLGGLTRFGLGRWVDGWHSHHFPLGTFVVNVVACFALGFIIGLADHKQVLCTTVPGSGFLRRVQHLLSLQQRDIDIA